MDDDDEKDVKDAGATPEMTAADAEDVADAATRLGGAGAAAPVVEMAASRVRFTPEDDDRHIAEMVQLVARGASRPNAREYMHGKRGVSHKRFDTLWDRVLRAMSAEFAAIRPHAKAMQVSRLEADSARIRSGKDAQGNPVKPNWNALARIEMLLADIYGTRDPLQVNVGGTIAVGMAQMVAEMSQEQMDELLERGRERDRLAAVAEKMLAERRLAPMNGKNGANGH
jgi:hypothetical protein